MQLASVRIIVDDIAAARVCASAVNLRRVWTEPDVPQREQYCDIVLRADDPICNTITFLQQPGEQG